ncbi:MAG: prolipoprotein diacylglyceryl transferase [Endomicrobium sp.]|jgi:phosphatidylglycerol:prolipoprotein diacylglycerol transferase|nr:prolipoprotein diacylglyceryl transferase [Endomicrobium sp.]
MHPILLSFGGFTIYTYGLFVAVGFFLAALYVSKNIKSDIISQDDIYSLFLYAIISSIIGARLLYVLTEMQDFMKSPLDIFKIWNGGLIFYGGFIIAVTYIVWYTKRKKIPLARLSDIMAPALGLGHFFGRIGCFFAGCCYGKTSNMPWSVVFNNTDTLAVKGIHIHPTQLYEAFGNLAIFTILHFYNKKEHAAGKTFALYLIIYAILRFTVEFFRGDYRGAELAGLSVSQIISVFLFSAGLFIIYKTGKK